MYSPHLLLSLINNDLRSRWSGTALSWIWAFLQPLAQIALFATVFGNLMANRSAAFASPGYYVVYLCCGLFLWSGFSEAIARGAASLKEKSGLLRGRSLFMAFIPLASVGSAWIVAIVGIVMALAITPFAGVDPRWTWTLIPLPILAMALMSSGLALGLAPIQALIKDTANLLQLILQLCFWLTPVVYDPSILPAWAQEVVRLNPIAVAVISMHKIVLDGILPSFSEMAVLACGILVSQLAGWWCIRKLEDEVRDAL